MQTVSSEGIPTSFWPFQLLLWLRGILPFGHQQDPQDAGQTPVQLHRTVPA